MKNKGIGALAIGIIAVVLVMAVITMGAYFASVTRVPTEVTYKGEFSDVDVPEDVAGTDLQVETEYDEDDDEFNVTFETTATVNSSDGQTTYAAFAFEVEGTNGFEALSIDGELNSDTTTSEMVIKNAYIMRDEEGLTLDKSNALYTADVDTDLDKYSIDTGVLPAGDYILVTELKGIATSTIAAGDGLVDIDFKATTDGDVDKGTVWIENNDWS